MRKFSIIAAGITGCFIAVPDVVAQSYPAKPIRVINPYTAGGGVDAILRPLTQKMGESLGQTFPVDNRPGANGRPRAVNRVPACGMRTSASRDARR